MKREILFRGKRIDNGEWMYGDLITDGKNSPNKNMAHILPSDAVSYDFNECIHVSLKTIGQFTGLTDKNGTKIFEGDLDSRGRVVMWNDNLNLHCLHQKNRDVYIVCYYPFSKNDALEIEITGNIHENKEKC